MSALTDRIAEVLREHHWAQSWHGCNCDGTSVTIPAWAAHVAERIEAELGLIEDRKRINPQTKPKPCDNCGHLKGIHAEPCHIAVAPDFRGECGCPKHRYTPPMTTWVARWVSAWSEVAP